MRTDKYDAVVSYFASIVIYQQRRKSMEKTVLNEVFDYLKEIKAVDTESEFSTDWLCRSECYMRTLRFKQTPPSIGTLAICASKLSHYGNRLKGKQKHTHISAHLLQLSNACHQQINHLSNEQWTKNV
jgi:hypothetical protein